MSIFLAPAMKVADELTGIPLFETPDFSEVLSEEKDHDSKIKKSVFNGCGFWGPKIRP